MAWGEVPGVVFVAIVLALLGRALVRMRPLWPYLGIALSLLVTDVSLRQVAATQFATVVDGPLVYAENPVSRDSEDLNWPNRAVTFLFVTLSGWLTARPQVSSRLIGAALALVVPGGLLNLVEPLLRGFTTDYLPIGDLVINLADVALVVGLLLLLLGVIVAEARGYLTARIPNRSPIDPLLPRVVAPRDEIGR